MDEPIFLPKRSSRQQPSIRWSTTGAIAFHWPTFVLVVMRAVVQFESWIREHLLPHERICGESSCY
jgi:hypothetical protein